uniref:Polyprotein protein n=1 Tax=Solanum tuberosum TaxID=4113 RepID=M1DDK2_SOLTU
MKKRKRSKLHSKAIHDPLALPPKPHASQALEVPHIPVIPPRSINHSKVVGLWTIPEEKWLSIDGVVERYSTIWETLQYHKFKQFTKPQRSYVPKCVRKFYEGYTKLIPKGKKKANLMAPIDFLEVRGKKVKCCDPWCQKTDIEVIASLSCVIHWIKEEYLKDEAKKKKKTQVDTSPVIDVDSMEVGPSPPTPTVEPSVLAYFEIPAANATGDSAVSDKDGEYDTLETDEEDLFALDIVVCEDLEGLEGDMLLVAMETSLRNTFMIGSSGSNPTEVVVAQSS